MKNRTLGLALLVLLLGAVTACGDEGGASVDSVSPQAEVQRVALRDALGVDDLTPVGVTIEPGTGRRLVLDAQRGIYALDAQSGEATLVWGLEQLANTQAEVGSEFTDMVAIDEGVFALTAISDGFLLDLNHDTLRQHFCYEPDFFDEPFEEPALQITQAVAFDPQSQQIIAQPQTILSQNFEDPAESLLATYDRVTGQDLQWFNMPRPDYIAGGMISDIDGSLLLGVGARLDRYVMGDGNTPSAQWDLSELGVNDIQGMAMDTDAQTLLILDGDSDTLIELSLERLQPNAGQR